MSEEVKDDAPVSQKELKKDWKMFKVVSKPDSGEEFFTDPVTGAEREYVRITEGLFPDEKTALKSVENSNYNVHVEHNETLYEVVSVTEVKADE